jgi:hypothetical protein
MYFIKTPLNQNIVLKKVGNCVSLRRPKWFSLQLVRNSLICRIWLYFIPLHDYGQPFWSPPGVQVYLRHFTQLRPDLNLKLFIICTVSIVVTCIFFLGCTNFKTVEDASWDERFRKAVWVKLHIFSHSRDSWVSVATRLLPERSRNIFRHLAGQKDFSVLRSTQTGSGTNPGFF